MYPPHRPYKILYASLYADVRPTFVVDITPFVEERYRALMAYRSQYANAEQGSPPVRAGRGDSRANICGGAALRPAWRVSAMPSRSFRKK